MDGRRRFSPAIIAFSSTIALVLFFAGFAVGTVRGTATAAVSAPSLPVALADGNPVGAAVPGGTAKGLPTPTPTPWRTKDGDPVGGDLGGAVSLTRNGSYTLRILFRDASSPRVVDISCPRGAFCVPFTATKLVTYTEVSPGDYLPHGKGYRYQIHGVLEFSK
jgi:hypothetical protein